MCIGFINKGNDIIVGYNLDLAIGVLDYKIYAKKDMFYIGIKVGSTVYKTHGINKNGNFGNLPYMNAPSLGVYRRVQNCKRIDLIIGDYIAGKTSYADVKDIVTTKEVVNIKGGSMHSLLCDVSGDIMLIEPGAGIKEIHENYAVISNFPLLVAVPDLSPVYYGKNRYDIANNILEKADADFSLKDGLSLLEQAKQDEPWATRVSFVYSYNKKQVLYVQNNDFSNVYTHNFE